MWKIRNSLEIPYGAKTESWLSGRFTIVEIEHTAKPFSAVNRPIG